MKRVLLISTVHPATDPRIFYKIAPSLMKHYELFCVLPGIQKAWDFQVESLPRFQRLFFRLLFAHPLALWKCLRIRPDVVHIFVPELIPLALLLQWLGTKVIYEVQENLYKKFAIKRYNNHITFRYLFYCFDHIARRRFHCIFTEKAYLNEYRTLTHPYAIIHNYASVPLADRSGARNIVSDNPVFFYSGVISLERCFDVLLIALSRLKHSYPDFHMHLFGPVRINNQDLKKLSGYEIVAENLTFHGYTDQKVTLAYSHRALAGIALLKPVADYPESYPTKIFEYMAAGLPVITSDFPIYREIVERSDCGFCISPYDADALCQKLTWCIENDSQRIEMGNNGRKSAEYRYNWKIEEKSLILFYSNLLKS